MGCPHYISTLLYCFNASGEVLLMERAKEPNLGLWSPCGGKLDLASGESPYMCARREAREELGLELAASDLHLTGLVAERAYGGEAHWLMFLFEVKKKLDGLPAAHREGRFAFFYPQALENLKMPATDREKIWPYFWEHRGGFFSAYCDCLPEGRCSWVLEESICIQEIKNQRGLNG